MIFFLMEIKINRKQCLNVHEFVLVKRVRCFAVREGLRTTRETRIRHIRYIIHILTNNIMNIFLIFSFNLNVQSSNRNQLCYVCRVKYVYDSKTFIWYFVMRFQSIRIVSNNKFLSISHHRTDGKITNFRKMIRTRISDVSSHVSRRRLLSFRIINTRLIV